METQSLCQHLAEMLRIENGGFSAVVRTTRMLRTIGIESGIRFVEWRDDENESPTAAGNT
jgi:hypothetical protein